LIHTGMQVAFFEDAAARARTIAAHGAALRWAVQDAKPTLTQEVPSGI
jgi:hypothetical protein